MSFRRFSLAVCAAALCVSAMLSTPCPAAEPDSREALENRLFLVRRSFLRDVAPAADGIRSIDPQSGMEIKHRQLFTNDSAASIHNLFGLVDGISLAFSGERLHAQNWPYSLVFDVFSWRMINRLPTPEPEGGLGWALQGPILPDRQAAAGGLTPGTYGIARCVRQEVTSWFLHVLDCTEISLSAGLSLADTAELVLLHSGDYPTDIEQAGIVTWFDDEPIPVNEYPVISFDPERIGFWRGTRIGAVFHPVLDGVVAEPSIVIDFSEVPGVAEENMRLKALVYHPRDDRLFAWAVASDWTEGILFAYDPESHDVQIYPPFVLPSTKNDPVTIAAMGSPPDRHQQIIPIIAEAPGDNSNFWTTDLWLFNPANAAISIEMSRMSAPSTSERVIELGRFASTKITNVLEFMGGGIEGDGTTHDALYIDSPHHWGAQLVAVGRMKTPDAQTNGSFGHAVPAVPMPYGYSNHQPFLHEDLEHSAAFAGGNVSYLSLDLRQEDRFRHNMGITNVHDSPVSVELIWSYSDFLGDSIASDYIPPPESRVTIEAAPKSITIVDIRSLFPNSITTAWPPRVAVLADTPTPIWYSMVDNITGDATYVPYTNFSYTFPWVYEWDPVPGYTTEYFLRPYRFVLPVAVHSPGVNGSYWVTDLFGFGGNGVPWWDQLNVAFYPAASLSDCNGAALSGDIVTHLIGEMGVPFENWVNVDPFPYTIASPDRADRSWRTIYPDVLRLIPECIGDDVIRGGLGVLNGSWFSGFSRTYTTREDGGTYGSMLPLYPPNGWPVQHFASIEIGSSQRVNLGLFNGDYESVMEYEVTLFSGNGDVAAEAILALEPLASFQKRLEHVFELKIGDLPAGSYGLSVLPINADDPEKARSWAYVSVVDNATNDPINLW